MRDQRTIEALQQLLRRLSAHSSLGAEDRQALLALPGAVASVKTQRDIVHAGEPAASSCLVTAGLVARVEELKDGRRQFVSLYVPGDLVDLHSVWFARSPATLQAVANSSIVQIPHAVLRDLIATRPEIATALWRDTVLDAAMMAQAVVRIGQRDAFTRMAHLLCEMAVRICEGAPADRSTFLFPITQEQLGDTLGLTSVHINRTIRALREGALCTVTSGRVAILNWNGLKRAAGFEAGYLSMNQPSPATKRTGTSGHWN